MDEPPAVPETPNDSPPTVIPQNKPALWRRMAHVSHRDATLIAVGWLGTGLSLQVAELPIRFLLKEELRLQPEVLSGFLLLANIPIYIKPFAGILSDAVPLFGTRRKSYLLISLFLAGLFWLALALVPRSYSSLLWTYIGLNVFLTLTSTVLGGLMVEVGKRDHNTGALSAQRHGINQVVRLVSDPAGGLLSKLPFLVTGFLSAALQFVLVPVFWLLLKEPKRQVSATETLAEVRRQFRALVTSRGLWSAAGLVILVIAAPGFKTALLYYQQDVLGFSKPQIGVLGMVAGLGGIGGALLYGYLCRRWNLRRVLAGTIIAHAVLTLLYLGYRTYPSALVITAIEGATLVLAVLPLYDLSARATPRGSEALGYCIMMSVWNFTFNISDVLGSWIYEHVPGSFYALVWVNTATTAIVLFAVPFLPAVLMDRRDGEMEVELPGH